MLRINGNMRGEFMQNNSLSLLATLCLSTAFFISPVYAQNAPQPLTGATAGSELIPADTSADTGLPNTMDAGKAQEKQLLEAELSNTAVSSSEILDFPARTSLGELEMATLPGIKESLITGPAPMAPSVSTKDLPSEQLLGRITSEVFQEMADLERGNVFLKLQMQKEQLKNDLEKLKATYRQTRLEEIAKREDVVRSRINWWQEQENVRLEMEKKKAETDAIEQQIAEAEELRNKLREEAMAEKEAAQKADADSKEKGSLVETEQKEETKATKRAIELYTLIGVRGVKTKLTARLKNLVDGSIISVKVDEALPSGHKVSVIERESITLINGSKEEVLLLNNKGGIASTNVED